MIKGKITVEEAKIQLRQLGKEIVATAVSDRLALMERSFKRKNYSLAYEHGESVPWRPS